MLKDPFESTTDSPTAPACHCYPIVPDDAAELPVATKALYIGTAGDLTIQSLHSESAVTFSNLPAGSTLDVRTRKVFAQGTTAADIVGLA